MDHQITIWGKEDVTSVWQAEHREQVTEPHVSPRRNELKSTNSFSETNESNYKYSVLCDQPTPVSVLNAYQQSHLDKTNFTYLQLTQCQSLGG